MGINTEKFFNIRIINSTQKKVINTGPSRIYSTKIYINDMYFKVDMENLKINKGKRQIYEINKGLTD